MKRTVLYEISPFTVPALVCPTNGTHPPACCQGGGSPVVPTYPRAATAAPSCLSHPFLSGSQGPCQPTLWPPSSSSPSVLQKIAVYSALFYPQHQKKSPRPALYPQFLSSGSWVCGIQAWRHKGRKSGAASPSALGLLDLFGPVLQVTAIVLLPPLAITAPLVSPPSTSCPVVERGRLEGESKVRRGDC